MPCECVRKAGRSDGVGSRQGSVFPVPGVAGSAGGEALNSLQTLNNSRPRLSGLGGSWAAGGKEMDLISLTSLCSMSLISWETKTREEDG